MNTALQQYIFNCVVRYNSDMWRHREDVEQEIVIAVLLSDCEKAALRMASRNCQRLMRQFGYRYNGARQRYEAHALHSYKLEQNQTVFN